MAASGWQRAANTRCRRALHGTESIIEVGESNPQLTCCSGTFGQRHSMHIGMIDSEKLYLRLRRCASDRPELPTRNTPNADVSVRSGLTSPHVLSSS